MEAEEDKIQISNKRELLAAFQALHHRVAALEARPEPPAAALPTVGDQMQTIVRSVPDIVYQLDLNGNIVFISEAISTYGYSPEELIGGSIFDIIHPDDREKALYRINERRSGERSTRALELRLLTKNKHPISFEFRSSAAVAEEAATLLVDAEGIYAEETAGRQFLYTQGVARDISERQKKEEYQRGLRQQLEERVFAGAAELQETNTLLQREVAERKRAVEALRQSEERYRLLVETSPDAVYVLRGGRIVFANTAGLDFLAGNGDESVLDQPLFDFLFPAGDQDSLSATLRQQRFCRLDGSLVDAEVRTVPFVYEKEPAVLLVARDITQTLQQERRREIVRHVRETVWGMRETDDLATVLKSWGQDLAQAGIACSGCAIQMLLDEGKVRHWRWRPGEERCDPIVDEDPLVASFFQAGIPFYRPDLEKEDAYSEYESLAASWGKAVRSALNVPFSHGTVMLVGVQGQAFGPEDIAVVEETAAILSEGCRRVEDGHRLAGRSREAEATAASAQKALEREEAMGQVRDRIIAMRDIADLPGEDFWIETLERLGVDVDAITLQFPAARPGYFVSYDFDRHVYSAETPLVRFPWIKEVWDGDRAVLVERQRLDELGFSEWEIRTLLEVPLPGGGSLGVNSSRHTGYDSEEIRAIHLCAGLLAEGIKRWQDFRALDESEEQLRQAQKMEAVGQLTAGIAHNFNNILQGVMGNLHLGLREADEGQREVLQDAEKGARRAADLVQQLMVFARQGIQPVYGPLSVKALIDVAVDICRQTFDRRISLEVDGEIPDLGLVGDIGQLQQVLLNLCLNARDAIDMAAPSQARILWRVSRAGPRPGAMGTEEDFVRIDVEDNGIGMEDEVRRRIFDPFFTTKDVDKGLGLGLSTVYGIVHQHRGWIECDSVPGEGTHFAVYLPALSPTQPQEGVPEATADAAAETTTETAADAEPEGMPGGNETILVIEDEQVVRDSTRRVLESCGYQVHGAADGPEGIEAFGSRAGGFDLVLLDLSMPSMSGGEVLERLRQLDPAVKVLIFTGYGGVSDEFGPVAGVVQKPFLLDALARQVRRALDT
jgi:PAS domain S-box-containing protein